MSFREDDLRRRREASKPSSDLLELGDLNFGNPLVQPPPAPTRCQRRKTFISSPLTNKLECLFLAKLFQPSLMFVGKARSYLC